MPIAAFEALPSALEASLNVFETPQLLLRPSHHPQKPYQLPPHFEARWAPLSSNNHCPSIPQSSFFEHNFKTNWARELQLCLNWRHFHIYYKSHVVFHVLMILVRDIEVYTLIYLISKFQQQLPPKSFLWKSITSKLFKLESWGWTQIEDLLM